MQKFISSSVFKNFKDSVVFAQDLGVNLEISRISGCLDNIDEIFETRIEEMKEELKEFKGEISLHSFFIDLTPVSADPLIRKVSHKRFEQCLRAAIYLNAKTVVFHTGYHASLKFSDYYLYFKEEFILYWKEFVNSFEKAGIIAVLENVEELGPEFILDIIKAVDSPNLQASIDIGHAHLHSNVQLADWIRIYGKYLYHMHLHNNYGDDDTHQSLLSGTINPDEVFETLKKLNLKPKMVFEIFEKKDVIESIAVFDSFFETKQKEEIYK